MLGRYASSRHTNLAQLHVLPHWESSRMSHPVSGLQVDPGGRMTRQDRRPKCQDGTGQEDCKTWTEDQNAEAERDRMGGLQSNTQLQDRTEDQDMTRQERTRQDGGIAKPDRRLE